MNPQIEKEPSETEKYVDKLLKNNNINLSFVPDSLERKIYIELITTITSLLENVVETTEIRFLDKKIILRMEDINENEDEDEDEDEDDSDEDDSESDSDSDDDDDNELDDSDSDDDDDELDDDDDELDDDDDELDDDGKE